MPEHMDHGLAQKQLSSHKGYCTRTVRIGGTERRDDPCKIPVTEDTNCTVSAVVVHHIPRTDIPVMKTFSPQNSLALNRISTREHPTLDYPTYRAGAGCLG